MMHRGNILCGIWATAWVAASAAFAPYQPPAPATPPQPQPELVLPGEAAQPRQGPPMPQAAMSFYQAVDGWVRAWKTPMDPMGMPPLVAACVTLRYESSVVGRAVTIASQPEGNPGILMLAASRAMKEAETKLPLPNDALRDEALHAAAKQIAITVEASGPLIPAAPATWAEFVDQVAPGLEGVAVRLGDRLEAMFPERMLETGTEAAAAGRALVSQASGDPTLGLKEPKALRAENGVEFYRFKVTVVGQAKAGKQPEFFRRGGRFVALGDLSQNRLTDWVNELAQHILSHPAGPGFMAFAGELAPTQGTGDDASFKEQLLTALALMRYRSCPGVAFQDDAYARVREAVAAMREGNLGGLAAETDTAAASLIALLLKENVGTFPGPEGGGVPWIWNAADSAIRRAVLPDGNLDETVQPAFRGLFVNAFAISSSRIRETAIRSVFVSTSSQFLVAQMPWLGWADLIAHPTGDLPSAPALREMRSQVWQHQLKSSDLAVDAQDLAGGIMFTTTRQPLPTWQAARPLAFIATMLGDPRLTEPQEVSGEIVHLLAALRYLRQLTASESEAHMYKDPAKAVGGVRSSVFDQRMPPEATAMTLLAVCETIKSLEKLKARPADAKLP